MFLSCSPQVDHHRSRREIIQTKQRAVITKIVFNAINVQGCIVLPGFEAMGMIRIIIITQSMKVGRTTARK